MGLAEEKSDLRSQARHNRRAQPDKDRLSRRIVARLLALPEYQRAITVSFYVDVRDEVRTRHDLPQVLDSDKRIAVPYCDGDQLKLFHLECVDELELGRFGILEPQQRLRYLPGKQLNVGQLDVVLVPGVAFDRNGGRLGHGYGYYDKLLGHVRDDALLVGLAYECQLFPKVPTAEHDVVVHRVLTESGAYLRES